MAAVHGIFTCCRNPLKIKRGRQLNIALAAIIDIFYGFSVWRNRPAEDAQVVETLTNLKTGKQLAVVYG